MRSCNWSPGPGAERALSSGYPCSDFLGREWTRMNTNKPKRFICVHQCSSVAYLLFLGGCGSYREFTLPPLQGGDPSVSFRFAAEADPVLTRDPFTDALNPSV